MILNHDTAFNIEQNSATTETPKSRRRMAIIASTAALALALTGVAATAAHAHKTITLDVDGTVTEVGTFAGSVESLLANKDITLDEHDLVTPAATTALEDGATVTVRSGSELTVNVDGVETTQWVNSIDVAEALTELDSLGSYVTLPLITGSADLLNTGVESVVALTSAVPTASEAADDETPATLPLDLDAPVVVVADGTTTAVKATTVDQALTAAGVTIDGDDNVYATLADTQTQAARNFVPAADRNELVLTVERVSTETVTTEEAVAFETTTQSDDSMYKDESKTLQAGVEGVRTITESVTTVNGYVTGRTLISDEVTTQPVTKIVAKGTKARPVVSAPAGGQGSAPAGGVWAALAQCESGGNPGAVSASGKYHGLYQFSVATWQSVGGSGLPSQASAAEQTQRAQALQARSGWGQWPACAKKLGLI